MSVYSAVECLFFSLLLAAIADVPVRSVLQVAAMSAFFNDECASPGAPVVHGDHSSPFAVVILLAWCTALTALLVAIAWLSMQTIRRLEADARGLAIHLEAHARQLAQHAQASADVTTSIADVRRSVVELSQTIDSASLCRGGQDGQNGQIDLLVASLAGFHYGLVELGGFVQHRDLSPAQRRDMFTMEQANRMVACAIGRTDYATAIRYVTQTVAHAPGDGRIREDEEMICAREYLGLQLNVTMNEEHWSDAAEIQVLILQVLDYLYTQDPPKDRGMIFRRIADTFKRLAAGALRRKLSRTTIERYLSGEANYRCRT